MQQDNYSGYDSLTSGRMPRLFWIIVGLSTVLAIFIVVFLLLRGFQDGERQAEAQRRQQIGIYMQAAKDAEDDGDAQAALNAYRRVLILDPENAEANAGVQAIVDAAAAPVAVAATATPALPTPTPTSFNTVELVWGDAQALYNSGRWQEAIDRLRQIEASAPDYEADQRDEMLLTAYVNLAIEKSNAGSLEEAVTLFDRALELRPNDADIRTQRDITAHYVDALTYWYADWPRVIELLGDIYTQSPTYRDVRQRLQRAHLEYADSLSRQGDWCAAAEQYGQAMAVLNSSGMTEKQAEFQVLCEQAPLEMAESAEETPVAGEPLPAPAAVASGLGTGRILYSTRDVVDGRYRIYAQPVTASVRPVLLVEDAMHPALRADGQRLVYRNMDNANRGLGSFDPGSGLRLRFTTFSEDVLPSWNPEGNRLVFASDREGDRRWRIYTAWADGNDNGSSLGFGQDPNWHSGSDRIVFRGCDERGNACGLWIMNGNGGDRLPITSVPGDARPTWSPDGRTVVFMSEERTGNWEIYRVDVQTGNVIQMTNDAAVDVLPTISPDGSRIAFLSNRGGSWQIWIEPIVGGVEQALAPLQGELPHWSESKLQWVP